MPRLRRLIQLALVSAVLAHAQTGTGRIQGTVSDATGAVMPGAKITVNHTQTARQFTTTSTEVGFYLFPSVQTGQYQITVEAAGMETWKGELTLQVGQSAEVNPTLKVGATATEVTVAGDVTPLVTTNSPTLANVVERARIEQLPVNGRFITNLIYMTTPGLEPAGHWDQFGLKQAIQRPSSPPGFRAPGPYQWVRHPMMLGLLAAFWSTPEMSRGHLLFAGANTLYVLVALRWEERDLGRVHGAGYERYRAAVPRLCPLRLPFRRTKG